MRIEIVSAARKSRAEFIGDLALGNSLLRLQGDRSILPKIAAENTRVLPVVYNERIDAADADSILVFVGD